MQRKTVEGRELERRLGGRERKGKRKGGKKEDGKGGRNLCEGDNPTSGPSSTFTTFLINFRRGLGHLIE
jgi:hypothetical protein